MSKHEEIQANLPFYLNGTLEDAERQAVAAHLAECPSCRAELELWQAASEVVTEENAALQAPPLVLDAVAQVRVRQTPAQVFQSVLSILKAQLVLVRGEIWTASFLVLAIGFVAAVLLEFNGLIYALAPLVASAGVGMIYGKDNDPAFELTLSTPVSQAQILLARLALVFGYDLLLVSAAYLGLMQILPEMSMSALLLDWLAPMALLSSLSLLLSLVFGSGNAISAAYLLWMSKFIVLIPEFERFGLDITSAVTRFWDTPSLLFALSAGITAAALLTVQRHAQPFKTQTNS